jgi:hypothetical protein
MFFPRLLLPTVTKITVIICLALAASSCGGETGYGVAGEDNDNLSSGGAGSIETRAPQLVGVSSISGDSLTLDWLAPDGQARSSAGNQVEPVVFQVHLSHEQGFIPEPATLRIEVSGEDTATVNGLEPGRKYFVKVAIVDAKGNLVPSNEIEATTPSTVLMPNSSQTIHTQSSQNAPQAASGSLTYEDDDETPQVGDVVVSAEGEGYLRRVTKVTSENGVHTVDTEPASLNQVFQELEFSTTIKSTPIPAGVTTKSAGGTVHPNTKQWSSGLTLTNEPFGKQKHGSLSQKGALTTAGDRQTYKDDYYQLEAPRSVVMGPDEIVEINLTATQHKAHAKGLKICEFSLEKVSHPDKDSKDINFVSAGREVAASNNSVRKRFTLSPSDADLDNEGKPYAAKFRLRVEDVYSSCNDPADVDDFSVVVLIYVVSGEPDLPGSVKTKLQSSLTVDYGITPLFKPEISVHAKIKNSKLQDAHVIVTGDYRFTQDFTISGSAGAKISVEKSLINPVTFTKVFNAGPVPIVIRGDLRFRIAASGSVSGTVNLNQELALIFDNSEFGFRYDRDNGGFAPVRELKKEYNFSVDGEAGAEANITLKVIPDLKISFYEAASARLRMEPYARGDAEVFGQFSYLKTSEVNNSDANYYFKELSVSGGLDIFLFAGLQIFDYDVISWPDIEEIDDALNMADGAFDESLFKKFSPIERTKILGIPELNVVCDLGAVPGGDTRKIWCTGQAFDVQNPFGSQPFIKFDEWDDVAVASVEMTAGQDYELSELAPNGGFSLLPKALAEYPVRISGHSDLGHFIRQSFVIQLDASDQGGDGMPDYWQDRYALTTDNDDHDRDGLSDLDEYKNGLNPTDKDTDDDGMDDAWEVSQEGLNPLQNDANEDRDGNGESNLAEYQRVQEELMPLAPENLQAVQDFNKVLLSWSEVEGADIYNVYYAEESFGNPPQTNNYKDKKGGQEIIGLSSPAVEIPYVDAGKAYYFVAYAMKNNRLSKPSSELQVLVSEDANVEKVVGNITAAVSDRSVVLNWDNSFEVDTSLVCRSQEPDRSVWDYCLNSGGTVRDNDVENGTTYYYSVSSTGKGANGRKEEFNIAAVPTRGYEIQLISKNELGQLASSGAEALGVDDGGNTVLLWSSSSNFYTDGAPRRGLYIKDVPSNGLTWIDTVESAVGAMSSDGRKIVYSRELLGDGSHGPMFEYGTYFYDVETKSSRLVSTNTSGQPSPSFESYFVGLSVDGRYVTYLSDADDLVDGDNNQNTDAIVWDAKTGANSLVSVGSGGSISNGHTNVVSRVVNGRWVVFSSSATNLVNGGSSSRTYNLYLRDLVHETTSLINIPNSVEISLGHRKIDFNGRYLAFSGIEEGAIRVYTYDLETETLVVVAEASLEDKRSLHTLGYSGNGRFLVMQTTLDHFIRDSYYYRASIALWDMVTGQIKHISRPRVLPKKDAQFGWVMHPKISSDGSVVVFSSQADNYIEDDTNEAVDAFLVRP